MNRQEFISFVEESQEALRRFLTALCCGDSQLADDIAQEAFVKAWLSCDTFRGDARFATWVRRIALNTFLNHQRSVRALASIDEGVGCEAPERADDGFEYQALYTALGQIPPRERSTILLYYMEGYSTQEIAEIEGISQASVRQHITRGRLHLRNLLND